MVVIWVGIICFLIDIGKIESTTISEGGLLESNFDEGKAEKWVVVRGSWEVKDGRYVQTDFSRESAYTYVKDGGWKDYIVEAKVKIIKGTGHKWTAAVILFRHNPETRRYYSFELRPEMKRVVLNATGRKRYFGAPKYPVEYGKEYKVKIICNGDSIKCFVNDKLMFDIIDDTLSEGGIGLVTIRCSASFDDIKVIKIPTTGEKPSESKSQVPELMVPEDGAIISDVSLQYVWGKIEGVKKYEILVSRNKKFDNPKRIFTSCNWYIPEEVPPPGVYFWKVRGVSGKVTPYSEVKSYKITSSKLTPPKFSISSENPIFLLNVGESRWNWWIDKLPSFSSRIGLRATVTPQRFEALKNKNLPVFLQVNPHAKAWKKKECFVFSLKGEEKRKWDWELGSPAYPLPIMEEIFKKYPFIKGAIVWEVSAKWLTQPDEKKYIMRLLRLCANYGRYLIWIEPNWGYNIWHDISLKEDTREWIKKYGKYLIPCWKMNSYHIPLLYHSECLGLWLSGIVEHWGINAERWFWRTGGLGKLGEYPGYPGRIEDAPYSVCPQQAF